jgi:Ca-activated chloride channel homolog
MTRSTIRRRVVLSGALLLIALLPARLPASGSQVPLSVRITSPLGRLGGAVKVRIVAQVMAQPAAVLSPVQFYVDGVLLSSVNAGPPYAVEWVDENPFEPREISVAVADNLGNTARDRVVLNPIAVSEETDVTSVLVDASVQDKTGRFIGTLDTKNFRVLEDGVPQVVDLAQKEDLPATFALLIDSSQSMSRRIDFVRETASRLASFMRRQDRMLVIPFARSLGAITGPTDDRATITESIGRVTSAGGTAIVDSLIEAAARLDQVEGRRAVVLITDGYDEHSVKGFEEALAALKAVQTTVYVVGIGGVAGISLKGERLLKRIATETGGRAFLPTRDTELEIVNDVLASDVQNRYLLSYTPSNQKRDGTWRSVAVDTGDPTHKVRARSGYFAPKPPPVRASIEFTMTDSERRLLDVSVDDFAVVEDGVEQTVEAFHESLNPVSIVLAMDASGSMKKSAETAKAAAARFVDALRPQDALGVLTFADASQLEVDLGTARDKAHAAIAAYQTKGGTALYDAVGDSLDRLKKVEGRTAIVVVTDGRDEDNAGKKAGSVRTFDEVLESARSAGATIFTIGIGQNVDRDVLTTLAAVSGGDAYFPEDVTQLEGEYRRIVENLRRRWIIGYMSTNGVRNGAWRSVTIRAKNATAVVHSRGGYFAPEK